MTLAQHSAKTAEHYTPDEYIAAAREVMGGIDLDPATTAHVNRWLVKATNFYTESDDGLGFEWKGRIWLNPPGGKSENQSRAAIWWQKLATEYISGRVEQAIFLGFSIEILATAQRGVWPGDFPFCIPRRRIKFLTQTETGTFVPGDSPTHSNIIVYLPPSPQKGVQDGTERFRDVFSKFGRVSR